MVLIKPPEQTNQFRRDTSSNFSLDYFQTICCTNFLCLCLEILEKRPSSWQWLVIPGTKTYPANWLNRECIEFEHETARKEYDDFRRTFFGYETEVRQLSWHQKFTSLEINKEHEEERKQAATNQKKEKHAPILLIIFWNIILHSVFSNIHVNLNNQQNDNPKGLYAHMSNFCITIKGTITEKKGSLHCQGYDFEECPDKRMRDNCLKPFLRAKRNDLVDLLASCCLVSWGWTFCSIRKCVIQNTNPGYNKSMFELTFERL